MICDWDSLLKPCMENVELMWNTIKTKTLEGIEKYIPVVLPFSSWKKKKWKRPSLPNDTRELIKQKKTRCGNDIYGPKM